LGLGGRDVAGVGGGGGGGNEIGGGIGGVAGKSDVNVCLSGVVDADGEVEGVEELPL
jgi:hypothetical protein